MPDYSMPSFDVAGYGQDLRALLGARNAGEMLSRPSGFSQFLDIAMTAVDKRKQRKREDKQTAEARTYGEQQTAQEQQFRSGEAEKARDYQTGQLLLKANVENEQTRLAAEAEKKKQEEIAAWMRQANEAAIAIYSDPNDPDAFRSSMAAIAEAAQHGAQVDINAITTQARLLRDELRVINEGRKQDQAEKALADVNQALDDWGSAAPEDKNDAANALARAATRYQLALKTPETIQAIVDSFSGEDDSGDGSKPLTAAEIRSQASFLRGAVEDTPKLRKLLPGLAVTDPDSAALANAIAVGVKPGQDTTMARQAGDIRASFIESKGRKRSPLEAFNRVTTGTTIEPDTTVTETPKPGPAKKSYVEDKVVDAWVAVYQNVKKENRNVALGRIPNESIRQKVKTKLGW